MHALVITLLVINGGRPVLVRVLQKLIRPTTVLTVEARTYQHLVSFDMNGRRYDDRAPQVTISQLSDQPIKGGNGCVRTFRIEAPYSFRLETDACYKGPPVLESELVEQYSVLS